MNHEHAVFKVERARELHYHAFSRDPYISKNLSLQDALKDILHIVETSAWNYVHLFSGNDIFMEICQSNLGNFMETIHSDSKGKLMTLWGHPYFSHTFIPDGVLTCIGWYDEKDYEGKAWSISDDVGPSARNKFINFIDGIE